MNVFVFLKKLKNIYLQISFQALHLKNIDVIINTENVEFIVCLSSFSK